MFCPNCGNRTEEGSRFCGACGYRFEEPANDATTVLSQPEQIPDAGATVVLSQQEQDQYFQPAAQENFPQSVRPAYPAVEYSYNPKPSKPKKKLPLKWIGIGAGALALLVVVIVAISLLAGGSSGAGYVLYLKDEQMFHSDFSGEPVQITEDLFKGYSKLSNMTVADSDYKISSFNVMNEDGTRLFYTDRLGPEDGSKSGFTLYYRNPQKPKQEPVKLDSGVNHYQITPDGKKVVYLKDNTLYIHDLKDREKVDSDVGGFTMNEDASIIYYYVYADQTEYGYSYITDLYVKQGRKEPERVDREVSNYYPSEDFKSVTYVKDGTVYSKRLGKDKEKRASDVDQLITVNGDGTFYYMEREGYSLFDFLNNDLQDYDLEDDFDDEKLSFSTLYFFDGKEKRKIVENVMTADSGAGEILLIQQVDLDAVGKIKLSEYAEESYYGYYVDEDKVEAELSSRTLAAASYHLIIDGKLEVLDIDDAEPIRVHQMDKTLYIVAENDHETHPYILYRASLSGGKLADLEIMDEDLYNSPYFYEDQLVYFKDVENNTGDLYVQGQKVDTDVRAGNLNYSADEKTLYYMADWDEEDSEGTLRYYSGGKSKDIAEDVYVYRATLDGKVVYLQDYSFRSYRGDLYVYNGRKSVKLDEDVSSILSIRSYWGYAWGW